MQPSLCPGGCAVLREDQERTSVFTFVCNEVRRLWDTSVQVFSPPSTSPRNTLGLRNRVWIFMLARGIKLPSLPLSIRHFTYGAISRSQRVLLGKEGAPSSATEPDRVWPNTATAVLLWPHNSAQFSSVYPCPEIKTWEPHLQQLLWERMAELRLPQRSVGVLRPRVGELDREHKRGIWKRSSVPRSKERSHSIAALPNPKALRTGEKSSERHQEAHGWQPDHRRERQALKPRNTGDTLKYQGLTEGPGSDTQRPLQERPHRDPSSLDLAFR